MSHDKLFYMANQIATFFSSQPGDDQASRIADHLNDFWAPDMRKQLAEKIEKTGGEGLHPLALEAAKTYVKTPA
ncbi:MAG: formate dehydrogenase subunit delta [Qingshengfaniella sp.]